MDLYKKIGQGHRRRRIASRFYIMHPLVIFIYLAGLICFGFIFKSPIFQVSLFAVVCLLSLYYNGFKSTLKTLRMCLTVGVLIIIINPLTNHRGTFILFYLFDNPITLESVIYGLINALMVSSLILIFSVFNTLIDSERFLYLFSRIIPKTAFVTGMSLRFSELYIKRGKMIIDVLKIRGISLGKGRLKERIKSSGRILEGIVTWSLEEGMETAQVLKAKNYGVSKRSAYRLYKFNRMDLIWNVTFGFIIALELYFALAGAVRFNPFNNLQIRLNTNSIKTYIITIVFLLMPFVFDGFSYIKRSVGSFEYGNF